MNTNQQKKDKLVAIVKSFEKNGLISNWEEHPKSLTVWDIADAEAAKKVLELHLQSEVEITEVRGNQHKIKLVGM